ncbi:proteinase inhibitor I4 serpin [Streptomyces sp. NBC_00335]|uniref:serpin family protein n=1 Tax=unclassified Streptomyces TaxID=2593676 RepID=UPI0022577426|nr:MULTISPECIES: serpin family protein [unclassified Streptomyces]MCX5402838.1 proteinase inhibitor I4 serpin [Streptomyces sp. NBC_00086]
MDNSTVGAVNRLTARWAARWSAQSADRPEGTVFTAAGLWPLLALLADGADGPARTELEQALGIPADTAARAARELLTALEGVRGLRAATGVWARRDLPLETAWSDRLPAGTRSVLTGDEDTDRKALDAWAAERTGGLVEQMPVEVGPHVDLVLASALALCLTWEKPFAERQVQPPHGPWNGRRLRGLAVTHTFPERLRVARGPAGPVTLLRVPGAHGTDVHLLLGEPGAAPGDVLAAGIAEVTGALASSTARELPDGAAGPGLSLRTVDSTGPEPLVRITTVAFEIRAEHDLLLHSELFGLTSAAAGPGHFPGISSVPLAVGSARQSAVARFHAEGFEAAAVTAVALPRGAARVRSHRVRQAEFEVDRPFGFLALDRESGLVLFAGWVTDPAILPR